jgi:pimeloyl-ACP methyl ester carboxylesterase
VARLLQGAGHEVFTPTLTGLGERWHLANPDIGLATHVEDVVNVLRFEQMEGVVLVGHSYGGVVITGVAENVPERIGQLVYVDAFVPEDGQALFDLVDPGVKAHFEAVAQSGDGWRIPYDPPDGPDTHRRTPVPIKVLADPLAVGNPLAGALPRTYIACADTVTDLGEVGLTLVATARRLKAEPAWRSRELSTGHVPMETMPRELTDLLLELA